MEKAIISLICLLMVSSVMAFVYEPVPLNEVKPKESELYPSDAPASSSSGSSSNYGLFKRYVRKEHLDLWKSCRVVRSDGYISNSDYRICITKLWLKHKWNFVLNRRID